MTNLVSVAGKDWSTGREYVVTASDSQTTYGDGTIARERMKKLGFHGSGFSVGAGNMKLMHHIYSEWYNMHREISLREPTDSLGPLKHIMELAGESVAEYSNTGGNAKDLSLIISGIPERGHLDHLKVRYSGGEKVKPDHDSVLFGGIGEKLGEEYLAQDPRIRVRLMTDLEAAINFVSGVSQYAKSDPRVNEFVQLGILTRKDRDVRAYAFYPNGVIPGYARRQERVLSIEHYQDLKQLWNLISQHVLNQPPKAASDRPQIQIPGIPAYR